jgi:hypothetical protein
MTINSNECNQCGEDPCECLPNNLDRIESDFYDWNMTTNPARYVMQLCAEIRRLRKALENK